MSLGNAIQIGRSALTASQVGIQVTGQNMANAATPGYVRQSVALAPDGGLRTDPYQTGRGVRINGVQRHLDQAIQSRLYDGISNQNRSGLMASVLGQLENVLGELRDDDLSSQLNEFFSTFSEAANLLQSDAVVVEQGDRIASYITGMRNDLLGLRDQVERQIDATARRVDELLGEVAALNLQIQAAESVGGTANGLRDQRDQILTELVEYVDINVIENGTGTLDVLIGSTPVVLGGENRGVTVRRENIDGVLTARLVVREDLEPLPVRGGQIGGLLASRDGVIDEVISRLDQVASALIFEVNRVHSVATDADGHQALTGGLQVAASDRGLPMNSGQNASLSALPFAATNGGFLVNVRDTNSGVTTQVRIDVDLDGRTSLGTVGVGDDTTPEDIRAALDAVQGITASWSADGRLEVRAQAGFAFSFESDSSGALAVLGMNSFFSGTNASDIGVRADLLQTPSNLSLGWTEGGKFVENGAAMAISALRDAALESLGGVGLSQRWSDTAQMVGVRVSSAETVARSDRLVRESLEAQRGAVSGVSIDEETIGLMTYQQQYQGAARLISVADELLSQLIDLL